MMRLINWNPARMFAPPSAETLARRELDEARRQLLAAQTDAEYAATMRQYHMARISRLEAYLAGVRK